MALRRPGLPAWQVAALAAALALSAGCANSTPDGPPPADEVYAFSLDERVDPSVPPRRQITAAALRSVVKDEEALDYVVKSRIYSEDPNALFLTLRGGGVSVYDVSQPAQPRLIGRACGEHDVEGQDRRGDLLVVVARSGRLLTLDVSNPAAMRQVGELELDTQPGIGARLRGAILEAIGSGPFDALHTMLYEPTPDRLVCLVSAPNSRELIAVDVSDPTAPRQIGAIDTKVSFVEAVYVKDQHAFVGGFGTSQTFSAVDVSDPANMRVVRTLSDPAYRQLVADLSPQRPHTLFVALWDDPGGLGAFDVTHPAEFSEIDRLLDTKLQRANRVKLAGDYAFLPLEQKPGGFGVVDVSRPDDLRLAAVVRGIRDVSLPYTLQVKDDWLYVFGTKQSSMAVFELLREP